MEENLSYHDLFITTRDIPRTSIFNLPYGVELTCTRMSGWRLWDSWSGKSTARLLAGEYDDKWLRLDVAGHVILDTEHRTREEESEEMFQAAIANPQKMVPNGWSGIVDNGVPLQGIQP